MFAQALAVWQWYNFYAQRVAPNKCILKVNLDETCVHCFESHSRGAVFAKKRNGRRTLPQRQPRTKRRKCLTHVALICNQPDIQAQLPQFVIGNNATFRKRDLRELGRECGPRVVMVSCAVCVCAPSRVAYRLQRVVLLQATQCMGQLEIDGYDHSAAAFRIVIVR